MRSTFCNAPIDEEAKPTADDFTALLTPVVKAMFTDLGFEVTSTALQCYGGHGYIRDHGMEQYVRDARIFMIYEGTNGVQALDLVGRKLPQDGGRLLTRFLDPVMDFIEANEDEEMEPFIAPLRNALENLQVATGHIMETGMSNYDEIGAASADYLRLFGLTALGFMWARMAKLSLPEGRAAFLQSQAHHREILHAAAAAADRGAARQHPVRGGGDDGDGRRGVLSQGKEGYFL